MKSLYLVAAGLLFVIVGSSGCGSGGPDIARVEGTVTMDGKPLPGAFVVFVPAGGRPAAAETDSNGKYVLEFSGGRRGAIPGKNRVEINTARQPEYEDDGTLIPGVKESVPARYNKQSTLEFDVVDGKKNIADFALESAGRVIEEVGAY